MTGGAGVGPGQGLDQAFLALVRDRLRTAMRARDKVVVRALRNVVAAVDNAGAPPAHSADQRAGAPEPAMGLGAAEVRRLDLDEPDLGAVLAAIRHDHVAMAGTLEGREGAAPDAAEEDRRAIEVIDDLATALAGLAGARRG